MAVGYYEFPIPSRNRVSLGCRYASGVIWSPARDGWCTVIDPSTDTWTEFPIANRNWASAAWVSDRYIVMVGGFAWCGVIDTNNGTFFEFPIGARNNRNQAVGSSGRGWWSAGRWLLEVDPVTQFWAEYNTLTAVGQGTAVDLGSSIVFIGSGDTMLEVDTATRAVTSRIVTSFGTGVRNAADVVDGTIWSPNNETGVNSRMLRIDPWTGSTDTQIAASGHRITSQAVDGTIWYPLHSSAIGEFDTLTGAFSLQYPGAGSKTRIHSAYVTGAPYGRIYTPHHADGTCGVYTDIPSGPDAPRGARGVGLARGART